MNERRMVWHRTIMGTALAFSLAALPFSVKGCHAFLLVVLGVWIVEGEWRSKIAIIRHSLLLQLVIAFFLIQALGLLFSHDLRQGWFSLEKKIFFLLIPIALATTAVRFTRREIRLILGIFVAACFVGTIICIVDAAHQASLFASGSGSVNPYLATSPYAALNPQQSPLWLFFSYVALSGGIGMHPTYLALFLAFSIVLLLEELSLQQYSVASRVALAALILYFSVFIVFLASRIVIAGIGVIYLVLLIRYARRKQGLMPLLAGVALFLSGLLLFVNPVSRYRNLQEIDSSTFVIGPHHEYANAAQIRASLWWLAIKSLHASNAFTGAGTGDVDAVMRETGGQYDIANVINSFDPHNQYLYTWLAHGLPGVLLLLLCLGLPVWLAWIHKDPVLLAFSFLFCLLCMTESALELQKGIVFYTVMSALLFFHRHSFQTVALNVKSVLRESH